MLFVGKLMSIEKCLTAPAQYVASRAPPLTAHNHKFHTRPRRRMGSVRAPITSSHNDFHPHIAQLVHTMNICSAHWQHLLGASSRASHVPYFCKLEASINKRAHAQSVHASAAATHCSCASPMTKRAASKAPSGSVAKSTAVAKQKATKKVRRG